MKEAMKRFFEPKWFAIKLSIFTAIGAIIFVFGGRLITLAGWFGLYWWVVAIIFNKDPKDLSTTSNEFTVIMLMVGAMVGLLLMCLVQAIVWHFTGTIV